MLLAKLGHLRRDNNLAVRLKPVVSEVILVVVLGDVEFVERLHLGHDRVAPDTLGLQIGDHPFRDAPLLIVVVEDHRPVLRPHVRALAVQSRRIMNGEVDLENIFVRDNRGIERNLHDLGVPRRLRAHRPVSRVRHVAARVPGLDLLDALGIPHPLLGCRALGGSPLNLPFLSGMVTPPRRRRKPRREVVKWVSMRNYLCMLEQMQEHWREFKESKPGQRFKDRYRRRRQDEQGHILWRIFLITLGAVIALGSLVLAPLPGPGWGTVFIGLMILAGELLPAARFLDWLEVRLRKLGRYVYKIWRASVWGKIAVILVAALCVAAVAYVAYLLLSGVWLF